MNGFVSGVLRFNICRQLRLVAYGYIQFAVRNAVSRDAHGFHVDRDRIAGGLHRSTAHHHVIHIRRESAGIAQKHGVVSGIEFDPYRCRPEIVPITRVREYHVLRRIGIAIHRDISPTIHRLECVASREVVLCITEGQGIIAVFRNLHIVEP